MIGGALIAADAASGSEVGEEGVYLGLLPRCSLSLALGDEAIFDAHRFHSVRSLPQTSQR